MTDRKLHEMDTMFDNEFVVMCFVVVQHFFVNFPLFPLAHSMTLPLSDPCSSISPDHHAPWPLCQGYHPCLAFFPSVASPDLQATIFTFGAVIVTPLYISFFLHISLVEHWYGYNSRYVNQRDGWRKREIG
jgi:hypothetical protein